MAWGRKPGPVQPDEPMNEPNQSPDGGGSTPEGGAGDSAPEQITRLLAERDELNARLLRTIADYQNSQRRGVREQEEAKRQAVTSVVLSVLPVLDHFDIALMQDPKKATAEQIIGGVKVIRAELEKVLQSYGVLPINPTPGEEFDPHKHQAVIQQESRAVPPGSVVATLQAGYALGDRVIRPAKVSIRPSREQGGGGDEFPVDE
jgi:molecular chaperone GrpE